jgi:uncharacterized MAPEG superfamily protein|mmetsp:Transcript_23492/g.42387  ORF Transcript_23492/g.42387 Transcript_23492/m.42387 type:complete len:192 (+) Transcript_23492:225-800(+)
MAAPPAPAVKKSQGAPPVAVIFALYIALGTAASFLAGGDPGTLPEDIVRALCPSIVVISIFLTSYSVFDVMAAGVAKQVDHGYMAKDYKDFPLRLPEQAFLAERAQINQVEQMPSFIFATLSFSLLVDGWLGALLALAWTVLRRLYARAYRHSVGVPFNKKGLTTYTIPCYFILNTMLMGSAIHALRWATS